MRAVTEDRHLTVRDLADRYGVSVWTIYGWNKTGTGPRYIKPGGSLCRYRLADVVAWEKTRIAVRGRVA
jgi:predicted DNA-binding transcriptional regulator AlpA